MDFINQLLWFIIIMFSISLIIDPNILPKSQLARRQIGFILILWLIIGWIIYLICSMI